MNVTPFAPVRLGLVGVGKIARDQHLPAIGRTPAIRLVAMADPNAVDRSIVRYGQLCQMLQAEPELTAVSIASPPIGRSRIARQALQAGKHVMLEKPPCATLGEARALADLAAQKGLTLFASWHSREAPAVSVAADWLAHRRIISGRIAWRENVRVWHPGQEWIFAAGGMGVFDPGINALSILTAILPRNLILESAALAYPANRESPIRAHLEMRHDFVASIGADFDFAHTGAPEWSIEILTDSGIAKIEDGGDRLWLDGALVGLEQTNEYARLYRRFASLIARGYSELDLSPLSLVADALLIGRREIVDEFHF